MVTLVLPGKSAKNKTWAEEIKNRLPEITIIYWEHWQTGEAENGWIDNEAEKIANKYKNVLVNVIAKSMGTAVLGQALKLSLQTNKIILCGVPTKAWQTGDEQKYSSLKTISKEKLVCIQNNNDPYCDIDLVKGMFEVIEKPRDDHDYPYFEEFEKFLI